EYHPLFGFGEERIVDNVHPKAEPFLLTGNSGTCILLIHGFTSSPSELRELGERLNQQGFTVRAPLLPGHGSSPVDLNETTWRDWYGKVKGEVEGLQSLCSSLFLVGLSMGGLLALKAAAELEGIRGVVTINAPIFFKGSLVPFARILRFIRPYMPKKLDDNYRIMRAQDRFAYDEIPVKAFLSVKELSRQVVRDLKNVKVPVLIFQSKNDESIEERSALVIRGQVGSREENLIWLEKSSHVATMGPELPFITGEICRFIHKHTN
ncbi:MAG TPA: alpha/beta fold hydrolase, partial [Syntrophothermus lipocalidus]|nr:alpha/beta fold hydrolase [Syntrophothermus lipocalidus]